MNKNILVSGGAGFIGSHVCKLLNQKGYTPIVIDNLSTGYKEFVKWGPLIKADIQDKQAVKDLIQKYKPIAAMNFASYINVGESVQNPSKYYVNNVANSTIFFETLIENNVKNVVFSSTAAVYGNPIQDKIDESHPYLPVNPYGQTKLMMEQILKDFSNAYDSKYVIFRYFNATGSDPELEIGESHYPETHLIPLVVDALQGRRESITVFGDDYDTADGTCVRDYIHVLDLAEAHVLGVEHLLAGKDSCIMNLGNGNGFSVSEVIDVVKKVSGKEIPVTAGSRRDGDPGTLVASSKLAKDILNWSPKITSLEDMVRPVIHWREKWFGSD